MLGAAQSGRRSSLRLLHVLRHEDVIAAGPRGRRRSWWPTTRTSPGIPGWPRRCAGSTTPSRPTTWRRLSDDPDHRRRGRRAPASRRPPATRRGRPPTGCARRCSPPSTRRSGLCSGLRFLDVYAGSGAVGLEARSRGAGVVTLVEQRPPHRPADPRQRRDPRHDRRRRRGVAGGARPRTLAAGAVRRGLPGPAVRAARRRTWRPTCARWATTGGWRTRRWSSSSAPRGTRTYLADGARGGPLAALRRDHALVRSRNCRSVHRRSDEPRSR